MGGLARRDGLILAILASVTLIPAGVGLASLLRELLVGEVEAFLGLYVPSSDVEEWDDVGELRADGENVVVTVDQDTQPHTRSAMNQPATMPVTTIWGGEITAVAAARIAKTRAYAAASTVREGRRVWPAMLRRGLE